ncbi:hypothetical protein IMSAGC009_02488 [Lachnospiraceae bacterium]|nr:hypothetical protein IMSAGC009_02488 [Lachnospiraceae bacterium]
MELKTYQKTVLNDLHRFLVLLTEKQSIRQAYNSLWEEKGVQIGEMGMPPYNMILHGVPHVCFKVPTGGGKTFLAASSIKPIFDAMPHIHPMAVVWLVPSDAILNQTVAALQNVEHPYRRRINADFPGNVEVYTKEQLLNGQKFNPASVDEQLSILVLSYDSFRTNKKEGRKAYQGNGYLVSFKDYKTEQSSLLAGTDETALIQVIRKLNPVIIVDESHHATSKLSVEMLENFNPSFVLDLTATPKEGSNIISFVDAKQLKGEEMIKLPVIVYNRRTQDDVFISAISLRRKLENEAKREEAQTGKYIRPIVLFQAEAKNQKDSTTYEKVKKTLLEVGVPEEQIAIKTADRDDLRNQNILAKDCKIRYIITVNALKEGWDCSFAYILATVANRSSVVDVEQILGRILRMPDAKASKSMVMNLSYVITSSSNFFATCEKVVEGLNAAGFSSKDYRIPEETENDGGISDASSRIQVYIENYEESKESTAEREDITVNTDFLKGQLFDILQDRSGEEIYHLEELDAKTLHMVREAEIQNAVYLEGLNHNESKALEGIPNEVKAKMKTYSIKNEFADEAMQLIIPQFVVETQPTLFSDHEIILLEK